jgi:hypothetical protein
LFLVHNKINRKDEKNQVQNLASTINGTKHIGSSKIEFEGKFKPSRTANCTSQFEMNGLEGSVIGPTK